MGLDASYRLIPRSEYRKHQKDSVHYVFPKSLPQFHLDREWLALHDALTQFGKPLSDAIRGNRPSEPFDDEWEVYDSFFTPGLVKKIDKALGNVTNEAFVAALKHDGRIKRKRDAKGYLESFDSLKAGFHDAASKDAYLWILIC